MLSHPIGISLDLGFGDGGSIPIPTIPAHRGSGGGIDGKKSGGENQEREEALGRIHASHNPHIVSRQVPRAAETKRATPKAARSLWFSYPVNP